MSQCSSTSDRKSNIWDLPDKPFQPCPFKFPSGSFEKTSLVNRSFQPSWFHHFQWIQWMIPITKRFDQPGYRVCWNLEDLVLKACRGQQYSEELDLVCSFYQGNLDRQQLHIHNCLFCSHAQRSEERELTIHSFCEHFIGPAPPQQLVKFSYHKTHLRATISQQWLNNILLLCVHKNETDALNL